MLFNKRDDVFFASNILLPKDASLEKWSVVACDQHTSDESYWDEVKKITSGSPSTLNLIIPEIYLSDDNTKLIYDANKNMQDYLNNDIFKCYKDSLVYVKRTLSNGLVRHGIIGMVDLEKYSLDPSTALVKPSEEIVPSRIPTRIAVKKNASLDIPHILLFCNDKNQSIIKPLNNLVKDKDKIYDFDLNMQGGNIKGYLLPKALKNRTLKRLNRSIYSKNGGLIVADGNHSLVAAKEVYEKYKSKTLKNKNYLTSPLRYAMVEVVNLQSEAIEIDAIHRVIKNVNHEDFVKKFKTEFKNNIIKEGGIKITFHIGGAKTDFCLNFENSPILVSALQKFIDKYVADSNASVDYIHETEKLNKMSKNSETISIELPAIDKNSIFPYVTKFGLFPRKMFSIGTSLDKRYYLECRDIRNINC